MLRLGALAISVAALAEAVIRGEVGLAFDLAFVATCVAMALAVRPEEFFTIGIAPPILLAGLFWILGIVAPGAIADPDDVALQALVSGMAHHANALMAGYALCLACLGIRRSWVQDSKRSGSPAPRRSTSGVPSE